VAQLLIRNLDDETKERLRQRAKRQGHSMQQEALDILRAELLRDRPEAPNLAVVFRERFRDIGLRPGEEIEELRGDFLGPVDFEA
jgi:plasmid stability protein